MIHYSNGQYIQAGVPLDPTGPAFRYGAGFFETICYNGKQLCHLDLHLDRLLHSLRAYEVEYKAVDFNSVIKHILNRNGLEGRFARVNIFYPLDGKVARPVVLAAPFEHAPYRTYRLCVCSDRHVSVLNAQKTTSYMFFHLAFKQALARGFNDSALFDFDGNLLEATTGAILLERDGTFVEMDSPYRLASTTLDLAKRVLEIEPEVVNVEDLGSFRHAYMLNSLIGMRPIVSIGETAFIPDEEACRKVTEVVLMDEV